MLTGGVGADGRLAWIARYIQDDLFLAGNRHWLVILPAAVVAIGILKGAFRYGGALCIGYMGNHIVQDIRDDLYRHMVRFPLPFYAEHSTGALISRVMNDVAVVQNAAAVVIQELIQNAFTVIGLTVLVFWQNPTVAPIALLILPLAAWPAYQVSGRKVRRTSRAVQQEMSDLSHHLQDTFSGATDGEDVRHRRRRGRSVQDEGAGSTQGVAQEREAGRAGVAAHGGHRPVGLATIIWFGGDAVITHKSTPGQFFSLLMAMGLMFEPIRSLGRVTASSKKRWAPSSASSSSWTCRPRRSPTPGRAS